MVKVYGASDDLIEIEGDIQDEISCYDTNIEIEFTDGTRIETQYGKVVDGEEIAVWQIKVLKKGSCFVELQECTDEDAEIYSDILILSDGVKDFEVC